MFKYFDNVTIKDGETFADHTLLLSAVSVGNVGQLAIDVVLTNAGPPYPEKIGRVFHPGLEAVVGTDPCQENGDTSKLVTSCEIFRLAAQKLVIVHFHAPVTMKRREDFVTFFADWIKLQNFKQVVCFSSTFAYDRNDQQLAGAPFRYISSLSSPTSLTEKLQSLGWEALEKRQFPAPAVIDGIINDLNENGVLHLPGSGITLKLLEKCLSLDIPFLALVMFASEGDNTPEALTMYEAASTLFNLNNESAGKPQDVKLPPTWTCIHGRSHPLEMF